MALSDAATAQLWETFRAGGGAELIRDAVRLVLQELIEAEATDAVGAGRYERSEHRVNDRNGHRSRLLATQAGDVELKIPKLRKGSFLPSVIEPRRRIDKALHAVIMEAYVAGVSTGFTGVRLVVARLVNRSAVDAATLMLPASATARPKSSSITALRGLSSHKHNTGAVWRSTCQVQFGLHPNPAAVTAAAATSVSWARVHHSPTSTPDGLANSNSRSGRTRQLTISQVNHGHALTTASNYPSDTLRRPHQRIPKSRLTSHDRVSGTHKRTGPAAFIRGVAASETPDAASDRDLDIGVVPNPDGETWRRDAAGRGAMADRGLLRAIPASDP